MSRRRVRASCPVTVAQVNGWDIDRFTIGAAVSFRALKHNAEGYRIASGPEGQTKTQAIAYAKDH